MKFDQAFRDFGSGHNRDRLGTDLLIPRRRGGVQVVETQYSGVHPGSRRREVKGWFCSCLSEAAQARHEQNARSAPLAERGRQHAFPSSNEKTFRWRCLAASETSTLGKSVEGILEMTENLLFLVSNHQSTDSGEPPHIDGDIRKRYHGYFENEFGEQAVFVYDYEVGEGTLWMGDAGWEKSYKVVEGKVPELLMRQNEAVWLSNCWHTAVVRSQK
ncbi:MAG: hypothetical protein ABI700_02185 [Chloroflexota bacterium]